MLDEVKDISGYLTRYGPLLAEKIQNEAKPLFTPGSEWSSKMER